VLASLGNRDLAGCALIGPLIEGLLPDLALSFDLMFAGNSESASAVGTPVSVRFTGETDLLFAAPCLLPEDRSVVLGLLGFVFTDRSNRKAPSRETATLKKPCFCDVSLQIAFGPILFSSGSAATGLM